MKEHVMLQNKDNTYMKLCEFTSIDTNSDLKEYDIFEWRFLLGKKKLSETDIHSKSDSMPRIKGNKCICWLVTVYKHIEF